MQFPQDCPKDKKITALLIFLPENLENFLSTELYDALLEGSTIFLNHSSTCGMSMESYRFAQLKYAIFSRTGRKTKKSQRSKLFLWTVFKHGLLEGSTILLQYSAITRTKLESSLLGELKYAISPGKDIRPKNKSIRKCKNWHCATSVHGHCIVDKVRQVRTGSDKSEQVWSTIFPQPWVACSPNLAHPQTCVQFSHHTSLETLRPSQVVETALRHASIGVMCELVWSATFLGSTSKSDTSLESSCLAEFECEI